MIVSSSLKVQALLTQWGEGSPWWTPPSVNTAVSISGPATGGITIEIFVDTSNQALRMIVNGTDLGIGAPTPYINAGTAERSSDAGHVVVGSTSKVSFSLDAKNGRAQVVTADGVRLVAKGRGRPESASGGNIGIYLTIPGRYVTLGALHSLARRSLGSTKQGHGYTDLYPDVDLNSCKRADVTPYRFQCTQGIVIVFAVSVATLMAIL